MAKLLKECGKIYAEYGTMAVEEIKKLPWHIIINVMESIAIIMVMISMAMCDSENMAIPAGIMAAGIGIFASAKAIRNKIGSISYCEPEELAEIIPFRKRGAKDHKSKRTTTARA